MISFLFFFYFYFLSAFKPRQDLMDAMGNQHFGVKIVMCRET